MSAWFVTGTDTGCGKTAVSEALVKALNKLAPSCGYKPVAAGCDQIDGEWKNEDGMALQAASFGSPDYKRINPYALPPAIAPHIAAAQAGVELQPEVIKQGFQALTQTYEHVIVEGAGGWRVPLSLDDDLWFSDIPTLLDVPVILVVGVKLGCINHATLTADAILASGQRIVGWVANTVEDEMPVEADNVTTLKQLLSEQRKLPLLAQFSYQKPATLAPEAFNLAALNI